MSRSNSRKWQPWPALPAAFQPAGLEQLRRLAEGRLREYGELRPPGWAEWLAPRLTWRLRDGTWPVWREAWGMVERSGLVENPALRFKQLRRPDSGSARI